ncbi:MAG: hypothetical protein AB1656_05635 [Candidatus Omnitrophota bacterium]
MNDRRNSKTVFVKSVNETQDILNKTISQGLNMFLLLGLVFAMNRPAAYSQIPAGRGNILFAGHRIAKDVVPGLLQSGDGAVNPGETVLIALRITNLATAPIEGVTGTLFSLDKNISLADTTLKWDRLEPGQTLQSANAVAAVISPSIAPPKSIWIAGRIAGPLIKPVTATFELLVLQSVNLGPQSGNGVEPIGLAFAPVSNRIYAANRRSHTLSVVARQAAASLPLSAEPGTILFDSFTKKIYVGHRGAPIVSVVNPLSNRVVQEIRFEGTADAAAVALSSSLGWLFAAHDDIRQISAVNLRGYAQEYRLTGFQSIAAIAFMETRKTLVVLDPASRLVSLVSVQNRSRRDMAVEGTIFGNSLSVDDANGVVFFGGQEAGRKGIYSLSVESGAAAFRPLENIVRSLYFDEPTHRLYAGLEKSDKSDPSLIVLDGSTGALIASAKLGDSFDSLLMVRHGKNSSLFAADSTSHRLLVFNGETLFVKSSITLGNTPLNAAYDAERGRVYVSNGETSLLSAVDAESGRLLESLPIGNNPAGIAFDSLHNVGYIALQDDNAIMEIRTNGVMRPIRRYKVGASPSQIVIDATRIRVIASCPSANKIVILNPKDKSVQSVDAGQQPYGVAVNEKLGVFYAAALGSSEIIAFHTATGAKLKSISLAQEIKPSAIAVDPLTDRVFVGLLGKREVWTFDAGLKRIDYLTAAIDDAISAVAVDSQSRRLYVTGFTSGQMQVYDLDDFRFIHAADVGRSPVGIAVDEDGSRAFAAAAMGGALTFYQRPERIIEKPSAPPLLRVETDDTLINLSWTKVEGALGYLIERSQADLGRFVPVTAAPLGAETTAYTDIDVFNGLKYRYRVRAVGAERRLGAAAISQVAIPKKSTASGFLFLPKTTRQRYFGGEVADFPFQFRPILGFKDNLSYQVEGDLSRIAYVKWTGNKTRDYSAPFLIHCLCGILESAEEDDYASIPLQINVFNAGVKKSVQIFIEIIPRLDDVGELDTQRESLARRLNDGSGPISLTADQSASVLGKSIVTISGEIPTSQAMTSIDLAVKKSNGTLVVLSGVLLENGRFTASIPVLGPEEAGNWRIEAYNSGNDVVCAGQSPAFVVPVSWYEENTAAHIVRPLADVPDFGIGSFLIIAGPPSDVRSQKATEELVDRIGGVMKTRQYGDESLKIMSADDIAAEHESLTLASLKETIRAFASSEPLFLHFLADADSSGNLILNENEILSPGELDSLLAQERSGKSNVIAVDGKLADAFLSKLNQPDGVLIASTGSGNFSIAIFAELADESRVSFSSYFYDSINLGRSIEESYTIAAKEIEELQGPLALQVPALHANNETLAQWPIGYAADQPLDEPSDRLPPDILTLDIEEEGEIPSKSLLLSVEAVDNRSIQSVSAVLGDAASGSVKTIALTRDDSTGFYKGAIMASDLPPLAENQTLVSLAVIATDPSGNLSDPMMTSIAAETLTVVGKWWKL